MWISLVKLDIMKVTNIFTRYWWSIWKNYSSSRKLM